MNYKEFFNTDNKSGWKSVDRKLKNREPEIYSKVIDYIKFHPTLSSLPFKEQIWHFSNKINDLVLCKECGGKSKYLDFNRGFQEFCSVKCSNRNKDKIKKVQNSTFEHYGVNSPIQSEEIKLKIKETNQLRYGVDNVGQNDDIKEKIKKTSIEKFSATSIFSSSKFRAKYNGKTSKIEKEVSEELKAEHKFVYENKEFDIKINDDIVEIDGNFFHPDKLINLSLIQINNVINDFEKGNIIKNSPKDITLENIKLNSYKPDYSIDFYQKIITKEYFKKYIEKKGKNKLKKYVPLLLKFLRTFHPTFPYPYEKREISEICEHIGNYKLSNVYDETTKEFSNNSSVVGNIYLKSKFKSYWQSYYKKDNISPEQYWYDDKFMLKVIEYRIGCNDSGEVFDFSLAQMIRGISAVRKTISFFKPVVAGVIYKHYLKDISEPTVFDPCSGFGGRLLGFKSMYPKGKYIGLEPDLNTFNSLVELNNSLGRNSIIINKKLEDFNDNIDYDIAFTSIPYFDLEIYSDNVNYTSFEDWKDTFIKKLLSYKRILINMPLILCKELGLTEYIDTYLTNSATHFSKNKEKKKEVIVKMNF